MYEFKYEWVHHSSLRQFSLCSYSEGLKVSQTLETVAGLKTVEKSAYYKLPGLDINLDLRA